MSYSVCEGRLRRTSKSITVVKNNSTYYNAHNVLTEAVNKLMNNFVSTAEL